MERGYGETEPRKEGFQVPRTQVQAEYQILPPDHTQGRRRAILSAAEWARNFSPLPQR